MKEYLNRPERVQLLYIGKYIDILDEILKEWGKRKNLTKLEHRALKTALTWGKKAFASITNRLNDEAVKTFYKSAENAYIYINDKYSVSVFQKKIASDLNKSYEENRDYYKLVELIFYYNCRNCNKKCTSCEIYEEFEKHCIPEPGDDDIGNCRYSYKDDRGEIKDGKK